jgi:DNA-damage-inducible protein D
MATNNNNSIIIFENDPVRRFWDGKKERWYFSLVDIILTLTGSSVPKRYWSDLKFKLKSEGSQVYDKIVHLKFMAKDGKYYLSDAADVETLLRLIQSIPSPKAEPFKLWLARVGYERMQEISDPEKALNRSRSYWQRMGRSEKWIQQRMTGQETRNKLTDYWSKSGVKKGDEFAILTNIIHEEWSEISVKSHKNLKGLKTQNLRDHMSEEELIFSALAELSTRRIAETDKTKGLEANKVPARKGGKIAKDARIALEEKIGKSVVTGENFLPKCKKKKFLR